MQQAHAWRGVGNGRRRLTVSRIGVLATDALRADSNSLLQRLANTTAAPSQAPDRTAATTALTSAAAAAYSVLIFFVLFETSVGRHMKSELMSQT